MNAMKVFYQCHLWIAVLFMVQGVWAQTACGMYEEGEGTTVYCNTKYPTFTSLEPRIEINGEFEQKGSCSSEGQCYSTKGYLAQLENDIDGETKRVRLFIDAVSRNMTRVRCYRDGQVLVGVECSLVVYVKASEPRCDPPMFIDEDTTALLTCTSMRVYPKGTCSFTLLEGNATIKSFLTPSVLHTNSETFPGDKQVTCQLRVSVAGNVGGNYQFQVQVTPALQNVPASASVISQEPALLKLWPIELYNPLENGHGFDLFGAAELTFDIPVTGNPPPNRVSLSARRDETSAYVPLSGQSYSVSYSATAGSGGGDLTLTVKDDFKTGQARYFLFQASNGVIGAAPLEYRFFAVDPNDENDNRGESGDGDGDSNSPPLFIILICGSLGLLIIIVFAIICVRRRLEKKKRQDSDSIYDVPMGSSYSDGYIDPRIRAFAFKNDGFESSGALPNPRFSRSKDTSTSHDAGYTEPTKADDGTMFIADDKPRPHLPVRKVSGVGSLHSHNVQVFLPADESFESNGTTPTAPGLSSANDSTTHDSGSSDVSLNYYSTIPDGEVVPQVDSNPRPHKPVRSAQDETGYLDPSKCDVNPYSSETDYLDPSKCDVNPYSSETDYLDPSKCDVSPYSSETDYLDPSKCDVSPYSSETDYLDPSKCDVKPEENGAVSTDNARAPSFVTVLQVSNDNKSPNIACFALDGGTLRSPVPNQLPSVTKSDESGGSISSKL